MSLVRRPLRIGWALRMALAGLAFLQGPAMGCSCVWPAQNEYKQNLDRHFEQASEVMVASVQSTRLTPGDISGYVNGDMFVEDAIFVVTEVFKGSRKVGSELSIRSAIGGGQCGVSAVNRPVWLEVSRRRKTDERLDAKLPGAWLIFGDGKPPYEFSMCGPSKPINQVGKELARLRSRRQQ
ncbi:hypothetical protein [Roseateles sp. BYS96W]|uniref:Uncharacterized protein n=1 Tax=Pelomonas nitida TaxID=3299027 RepID=A0ABW7GBM8_9BURK